MSSARQICPGTNAFSMPPGVRTALPTAAKQTCCMSANDNTANTLPLGVTDNRFGLYYPLRRMETESESVL